MFGQKTPQEDQLIPDQAIEGALADDAASDGTPQQDPISPVSADAWGHPGTPIDDTASSSEPAIATPSDVADNPVATPVESSSAPVSNDLLEIKKHALADLAPLVDHLEQSPEEKFRTTMMMLQASDDQSLVATAYEAAVGITDEKIKAQALLDVINEINYFTQQAQAAPSPTA